MTANIKGLSTDEVKASLAKYGKNVLPEEKRKGFVSKFFENLSDPIIRILIIAVAIEVLLTLGHVNYYEIFGILSAILISTTVSTVSEYKSEQAFKKMDSDTKFKKVRVIRGGCVEEIEPSEIVVGDVLYISAGESIYADGVLISGGISVDQSALNGESIEIAKLPDKSNSNGLDSLSGLYRGSYVTEGSGIMKIRGVGSSTLYGSIAKDVQAETRICPLKLRLESLAKTVSIIGYFVALAVGFAYMFNAIVVDSSFDIDQILLTLSDARWLLTTLLHALTLMITVVVVAAPEGLPMMITVVLSANMRRMLKDNIRVKKLVGIDTAGSLNILFTDKTGTLTYGKPVCERFITYNGDYLTLSSLKKAGAIYDSLLLSAKYNTEVIESEGNLLGGNSTDRAIYSFFKDVNAPRLEVTAKTAFSSDRKYSSVELKNGILLIKGAAEIILRRSMYCLDENGERRIIKDSRFLDSYYDAANSGNRIIAVAMVDKSGDYILVALIVMKDKLRREVRDAVKEVLEAGIRVVMITGDSKETAESIAKECGIISRTHNLSLGGDELDLISDDDLKKCIPNLSIVYRALPHHKTRLVKLSQELELVVGMTGDGINDAPSLKLADVGFAMGSGTDIAKSSADIVITDDSFLAIDKAVLYGRTIFKSIRKFIIFQLVMNLTACGVSLIGQFIGIDTPITIIQMLWVNIIMDTLGGLAFAGEPPLKYYMKEKPQSRSEPILNKNMLLRVFCVGAFTLCICLFFLTSPIFKVMFDYASSPERFYTAFYALFIFSGLFNCFAARSERLWIFSNMRHNKLFVVIMIAISVIQIAMIYRGGELFRCTPLKTTELLFVISLAFSVIPFDITRRIINRLK